MSHAGRTGVRVLGAIAGWRRLLGPVIAALLGFAPCGTGLAWEHYPMPAQPGYSGIIIGDFDGDGGRQAVIGGVVTRLGAEGGRAVLATIDGRGAQARVRSVSMPDLYLQDASMVLVDGVEGRDRVVAVGHVPGEANRIAILGGVPLQVERLLPLPAPYQVQRVHAVVDVDADGSLEIIASLWSPGVQSAPAILDWSSGAVLWVGEMSAKRIAVAQLDGDAALELVMSGTPGLVIDGATRTLEWSWAGGFGDWLVAGRFHAGQRGGFAALMPVGGMLHVYSGEPYAPALEIPVRAQMNDMQVVEVAPGSSPEIAVQDYAGVRFFDPATGALTREVAAGASGTFALGRITNDTPPSLINRARGGCPSADGAVATHLAYGNYLQMTRLDDGSCRRWLGNRGSHAAVARGALAGAGSDLIASYSQGDVLSIFDAGSGTPLRFRNYLLGHDGSADQVRMVVAARIGEMPSIVVASASSGPVAIDPVTLEVRWRAGAAARSVSSMAAIDVDGDGADEIVVATGNAKLVVLDGETGATIRESANGAPWSWPEMVAFHDGQGHARALVTAGPGGRQLDLHDLATASVIRRVDAATQEITGLWQWGQGTACRIAVLDASARIGVSDCHMLAELDHRQAPPGTLFVRQADPAGNAFIVAAGEHLYVVGEDDVASRVSAALGTGLGAGNAGDVRQLPGGDRWQVALGSDVLVGLQYIAPDPLFANGFD